LPLEGVSFVYLASEEGDKSVKVKVQKVKLWSQPEFTPHSDAGADGLFAFYIVFLLFAICSLLFAFPVS
jgi:hypothetical protein